MIPRSLQEKKCLGNEKKLKFTADQLEKHYRINAPADDHHAAFRVKTVSFDDGVEITLEPDNSLVKDAVFLNRDDIEALLARYVRTMWRWPEITVTWTDAGSECDRRRGEDYRLLRVARQLVAERPVKQETEDHA